ncbi:DNA-3-methyladenine glycosylase I [Swingsia samuiensis]|uniref:DNA-3-methyladenine glycosylase I n=1 Tax=Swingsia samuiensis TaxID=1293412 RepID=A0A4Y6UFU6_9PROT|nr:DNA-3-methyladenine glycosylase I [Swingsia samuiensis]QDH16419.1 DNA-3-methyladenine glycosylase I [Swingsia samuiensis]
MNDALQRCKWASTNPLLQQYHDHEWGVPVTDGRSLWEALILETFQAGLSWLVVLKRREHLRQAFCHFDPHKIAQFNEADIQRLLSDPHIIRSRAKIEATILNAQAYLKMSEKGEDLNTFLTHYIPEPPILNTSDEMLSQSPLSITISKELKKKGFRFVGPVVVYSWLQAVGQIHDHDPLCFRSNI